MTIPTVLALSSIGLPPYSARGLKETFAHIESASQLRRTVNGSLADVSDPIFRKYKLTITGEDVETPSLDLVWPGRAVTVDCVTELSLATTTEGDTGRVAVPGSTREENGVTFYRPRLSCRVTGWEVSTDEWAAVLGWTLTLEEI